MRTCAVRVPRSARSPERTHTHSLVECACVCVSTVSPAVRTVHCALSTSGLARNAHCPLRTVHCALSTSALSTSGLARNTHCLDAGAHMNMGCASSTRTRIVHGHSEHTLRSHEVLRWPYVPVLFHPSTLRSLLEPSVTLGSLAERDFDWLYGKSSRTANQYKWFCRTSQSSRPVLQPSQKLYS